MPTKISPSQIVTVNRCHRQWWLEKVQRLDKGSTFKQDFGTALHERIAAYLQEREPETGWDKPLVGNERNVVESLLDKAIEIGWVVRKPGLLVEQWFEIPLGSTLVNGRIDLLDREGCSVEDHKTTTAAKWAKKGEALATDIPMMAYAGYFFRMCPSAEYVHLRHNQFIMEDLSLQRAEVRVTKDQVRAFWNEHIIPNINAANALRDVKDWTAVPGHPDKSEACSAYGGCPFRTICHMGCKIEDFGKNVPIKGGAPF